MLRIILLALSLTFLSQLKSFGQFIETLPINDSILCPGRSIIVSFNLSEDFLNREIHAEISDHLGSFENARRIGRLDKPENNSFKCYIPEDMPQSSKYRIRIISLDPPLLGADNGNNLIITAPEKPTLHIPMLSCIGENLIQLKGEPEGGVFSGLGVVNDNFIPAIAGEGRHYLHYTFLSSNGCLQKASSSITVKTCNPIFGPEMEDMVIVIPLRRKVLVSQGSEFTFDKINIYNSEGRLIRSKSALNLNNKKPVIIRWLKKDSYILELSSFKGTFRKRFHVW
jgi:hypothetical protein